MISITVPLRVESTANKRWHWAKLAGYHKRFRLQTWAMLRAQGPLGVVFAPVKVTMTRIAPRELDKHDNLRSALKGAVDGVADWLKLPDNDPRIEFVYEQERGAPKYYALRVEVEEPATARDNT